MKTKTLFSVLLAGLALVLSACSNSESGSSGVASSSTTASSSATASKSHEHSYSDEWSHDDDFHWHAATCGHSEEVRDKGAHVFGEWVTDVEPTETSVGQKHRDCSVCDYRQTGTIDKLPHTHTAGRQTQENRVDPSCTEDGSYDLVTYCAGCGEEMSRVAQVLSALGHDLIHHAAQEATCTEAGWAAYDSCSRCDYSTYQEIPATGHIHTATREENLVEPTCTEEGSYDLVTYCTDDDVVISREARTLDALGHDLIHQAAQEATCTEDGWAAYDFCSRCDYSTYQEIPATGHIHTATREENRVEPTCTKDGSYNLITYCTDDAVVLKREAKTIAALGHDLVHHEGQAATCEEDGWSEYDYCTRCDYSTIEYTEALGHDFGEPSYEWNANYSTCTAKVVCSRDPSHVLEETVDSVYSVTKKPSYGVEGAAQYKAYFSYPYQNQTHVVALPALDCLTYTLNEDGESYRVAAAADSIPGDIVIPSTYKDLPVTKIASRAFAGCKSMTSIVIPNSVTSIEDWAFSGCTSLTSISLPSFSGRFYELFNPNAYTTSYEQHDPKTYSLFVPESLKTITLTGEVTSLDKGAFKNCAYVTTIVLPSSVISIDSEAFCYCNSLSSVNIPSGVTSIGISAFAACDSLLSLELPNGLEAIQASTFYECRKLESVTIPSSVNAIGANAFRGCVNLQSIAIPEGVTTISDNCFYACEQLKQVTLPNSLQTINYGAFSMCRHLASITIPENVTSIYGAESYSWTDSYSFYNCFCLAEVINKSALTITAGSNGNGAIAYHALQVITDERDSKIAIDNDGFISYDGSILVGRFGKSGDLVLPDKFAKLHQYAFYNDESLTSFTFTENLKEIGAGALSGPNLSCANYHGSSANWLTLTGKDNIYCETHLYLDGSVEVSTTIVVPNEITVIEKGAFSNCVDLTSIEIHDNVTFVGSSAFSGCSSLEYIEEDNGLYLGNSSNPHVVLVKAKDCGESFEIPDGCKVIYDAAFTACKDLTSIVIKDGVVSIGKEAFMGCANLKSVTLPDSLTNLGNNAFRNCSSLAAISIPNAVQAIGDGTFRNCSSLESVTLGGGIASIGSSAFDGCSSLSSINLPSALKTIGSYAFDGCSSLTSMVVPEGVTTISWNAFEKCSGLKSIVFPASLTYLGSSLLSGCSSLSSVSYNGTVKDWENLTKSLNMSDFAYRVPASVVTCSNGESNRLH